MSQISWETFVIFSPQFSVTEIINGDTVSYFACNFSNPLRHPDTNSDDFSSPNGLSGIPLALIYGDYSIRLHHKTGIGH